VAESANRVSRAKAGGEMSWRIELGGEPELCVSVVDFALTAPGSGLWATGCGQRALGGGLRTATRRL
jgi:hypothetical protein